MIFVAGVSQKFSFLLNEGVSNVIVLVNGDTGQEFHVPVGEEVLAELLQFAEAQGESDAPAATDTTEELVGAPTPDRVAETEGGPVSTSNEANPRAF